MVKDKNKVGEVIETFQNTTTNDVFKQSEVKTENLYKVVFKQNRTLEIYINNEKIIFSSYAINPIYPEKYKNGVPESIINNENFKSLEKYFTVTKI